MGAKLHLGCGSHIKPGYINIDEFDPRADVLMPLQKLDYPDNSIERIEGYMVLEHLSPEEARTFVRNAHRMLQPGGMLILEVPDIEKVCHLVLIFKDDPDYLEKGAFGLRGLFAEPTDQRAPGNYYKWGYTPASMADLARRGGFTNFTVGDGISHYYPLRDMRLEAVK